MFIRSLFNFSVVGAAIVCAVITPQVITPQVITPQLAFASPASDIEPASNWQHEIQRLNQRSCREVNQPGCNPS